MISKLLLVAISVFFIHGAVAQKAIMGRVVDKETKEPVEGALITVISSGTHKIADKNGNFTLNGNAGEFLVSCIGYNSQMVVADKGQPVLAELERGIVNLEELVIAPSPAYQFNTLSRIDLNVRPAKSSQELLRIVPGLFIAQHQGGGKAEQIFLRGFDIDHGTDITISTDGLPVNMVSHAHGQGYADMHFIIPELVKNIEYGKGPYYVSHGNFSTSGYVNLQTINKLDRNRIQAEAGQFNTVRTLAMINLLHKNNSRQNAYVAGEFLYSDGAFRSPQHFNRANLFGKYNLAINHSNDLTLIASAFASKWNASGQVPQRSVASRIIDRFGAIDDTETGFTGRTNASVKLHSKFNNGAELENQAYYSHYYFNLFSNFTFFLNDPINGDQINQRESRNIWGYNSKYTRSREWKRLKLKSVKGGGLRYDRTKGSELSHTLNKSATLQEIQKGDIHEFNGFLFLEEQLEKGKWLLSLGARYDYFHFDYVNNLRPGNPSQPKSTISPKLSLQYRSNDYLHLYGKLGKGFHSNDTRVIVASQGKDILPAAYGADIGATWKPMTRFLVNTAVWYLYLQQELVYVGDEAVIEPSGKARRYGLDFSARYQLSKKFFADIDLNFCNARSAEGEKGQNHIPLAPQFSSTGGIGYQSKNGLNGSLRYRYIKDRPANENNSVIAEGYFVTDLSLIYTKSRYEVGIIAENLFNTKWNEAQFETTSRLKNEPAGVTELHFTPGVPLYLRAEVTIFF